MYQQKGEVSKGRKKGFIFSTYIWWENYAMERKVYAYST
jgi:hypothetical protein